MKFEREQIFKLFLKKKIHELYQNLNYVHRILKSQKNLVEKSGQFSFFKSL